MGISNVFLQIKNECIANYFFNIIQILLNCYSIYDIINTLFNKGNKCVNQR